MHDNLETKLFFLDTNIYVSKNFQFNQHDLLRLQNHLEQDDCHLLITDINVREIKRHLQRKSKELVGLKKKFCKDAMILRNIPNIAWHGIFKEISEEEIQGYLNIEFDKFLSSNHVEIIKTKNVDIDKVFHAYFNEEPPFANSSKKFEFPDAFVLHAINSVSKDRYHKLYVVSADKDFQTFCAQHPNLIGIERLDTLIDLIIKNVDRLKEPAIFAEETYQFLESKIRAKIENSLNDTEFFGISDDWDAEFEIVNTEIESIEYISKNLVDVSKEGATYEVTTKAVVTAELSISDYDRSPWDSEDRCYAFVLQNIVVCQYTKTAQVIVDISYDDGILANAEIISIDISELTDLNLAKKEQLSIVELDVNDE